MCLKQFPAIFPPVYKAVIPGITTSALPRFEPEILKVDALACRQAEGAIGML